MPMDTDDDDGRRRRMTGESALEKLRCLPVDGAKKLAKGIIRSSSSRFEHS